MKDLKIRNQKIIHAVIEKANRVCPGSLAMIGVYGSFATGDFHDKSDLDLLVLINDDRGWQLGCTFIEDDLGVGHDIYCTTWEDLQKDSLYQDPNISKLMDAQIVYCGDEKYIEKLEELRLRVKNNLLEPLSKEDYIKAENMMKEAEHCYLSAMVSENMADIWAQAGDAIYYIENAIVMLNKKYFHFGTKRIYEELELMKNRPCQFCELIENVLSSNSSEQIKESFTILMQETVRTFKETKAAIQVEKKPVTAESVQGTYEEMYSNWRNKMHLSFNENNRHLAFMSMISLHAMISDVGMEVGIARYPVLEGYHPQDLKKTAMAFDNWINEYLQEYHKAGLQVTRYQNIDEFVRNYLE